LTTSPDQCPSCGAPKRGPYCSNCGERFLTPADFDLRHFLLHDLPHEVWHVDGKLKRTLRALFVRPGFLPAEYTAGRRVAYIAPLRLYLAVFLVHLALVATSPDGTRTLPDQAAMIDPTGLTLDLARARPQVHWSDPALQERLAERNVRPRAGPNTSGELMFDHVKFGVSDYAASKAFFLKALEPLGVAVVSEGPPTYGVELSPRVRLHCACTKPRRSRRIFTWRSRPRIASKSKLSIARLWRRAAKTMVRLVCARTTTRTTTQLLSLVRTGTTSKWFATNPRPNPYIEEDVHKRASPTYGHHSCQTLGSNGISTPTCFSVLPYPSSKDRWLRYWLAHQAARFLIAGKPMVNMDGFGSMPPIRGRGRIRRG
jgi:hypothetical protein